MPNLPLRLRCGAFRYILKNQPDYVYTKQLNSIIAECQQRFRTFTFNNKICHSSSGCTDILYFEGHRRRYHYSQLMVNWSTAAIFQLCVASC